MGANCLALLLTLGLLLSGAPAADAASTNVPRPAVAQGEPAASATPQDANARHGRGKRVSVWIKGRPISVVLEEVSAQTGIRLSADQLAADQKITVFARDIELDDLKEAIARTFSYQWVAGEAGAGYDSLLCVSPEQRRTAASLVDAPGVIMQDETERTLPVCLREGLPAWALTSLSVWDRAYLSNEFRGRARVLSLLSREQMRSVLRGGRLRYQVGGLHGESRAVIDAFLNEHAMPARAGWDADQRQAAYIEFYTEEYELRAYPGVVVPRLKFQVGIAGPSSAYSGLIDPARYVAELDRTQRRLRAEELRAANAKGAAAPRSQLDAALVIAPPEDGAASEARRLRNLSDVLEEIARAARVNIVADYHTMPPRLMEPLAGFRLEDALDKVASTYQHYWHATDKAFLFRSDRWWTDDAAEVPERMVASWRQALAEKGYFPLPLLAEIASLTERQLDSVALLLPEARLVAPRQEPSAKGIRGNVTARDLLRFYQVLDELARRQALSAAGLTLTTQLTAPQMEVLAEITRGWAPSSHHDHGTPGGHHAAPGGAYAFGECVFSVQVETTDQAYVCTLRLQRVHGDALVQTLRQPIRIRPEALDPGAEASGPAAPPAPQR